MRINMKLTVAVLLICLSWCYVNGQNTNSPTLSIDQNELKIAFDGRPGLIYSFRSVPAKPYVKALRSPSGINILRDAPHDHLHHHGLMFALKVNEHDFWSETSTNGRQIHKTFQDIDFNVAEQNGLATFASTIDWEEAASKKVLLNEKRKLTLTRSKEVALLTWNTTLKTVPKRGPVIIGGDHYFGLGMRFLQSMDKNGTFTNADGRTGKIFRGTERLVPSKWCAYQANADGKPVTVAMFDHPDNLKPVTWFTMLEHFSYLSATLKYHQDPFVLKPGDELSLTYGVAVWDGKPEKTVIEQAYEKWLKGSF